jgi:hypothetical protein
MDICMNGTPLDGIPAYNRVSIRAVLVHDGEDPGPALAAAGIVNPIAIPVVMGEDLDLSGGMPGNGITPNLIAVLETEEQEDFEYSPANRSGLTGSQPDAARPVRPFTTTAPPAFGMRSFAPIGRLGDTRPGRYGNNTTGFPPSAGQSLEIDGIPTSGSKNLYPSAGRGSVITVDQNGAATEGNPDAAGQGTANVDVAAQPADGEGLPEPDYQATGRGIMSRIPGSYQVAQLQLAIPLVVGGAQLLSDALTILGGAAILNNQNQGDRPEVPVDPGFTEPALEKMNSRGISPSDVQSVLSGPKNVATGEAATPL